MKKLNAKLRKNRKGITLVALVVTIVVLLILAGVSLNLLIGNNGIMTRAKQAKISNDLSSYKEQLAMFIADKKTENSEFYESSLTAGKNNLYYNTKTSEDEKTIKDIIKDVKDEYLDGLEVVKGKLTINTQDKNIIKVAQEIGVEPNPYVIKDGELMSNDGNLLLVDENGTLTLPDSVTKIGEGAFANVEGLKTIIIPGTVKTIGKNAFANNTTLEKVVVEDGVETIENSAFRGCTKLKEVELPDSITSIGSEAFYTCGGLEDIQIPANIVSINSTTFSWSGLQNVKFRGDKVKRIEREAFWATKIKELTITKNIEYIDATALGSCTELENIKVDTENRNYVYNDGILMPSTKESVLFISSKYYSQNTTLEIPEGVIDFTCSIANFSNITKLIIPASTKNMDARYLPSNISSVEISASNENLKVVENCIYTKTSPETLIYCYSKASEISLQEPAESINESAFRGATNATKITLNNETTSIANQVFSDNKNLKEVIIGEKVNYIHPYVALWRYGITVTIDENNPNYVVENNILYNKNKDTLITVFYLIQDKFDVADGVETIGNDAFYGQSGMIEINLNQIEKMGNRLFQGCIALNKVEIPNTIKEISVNTFIGASTISKIIINRKENAIAGNPFGSPFGLRAIEWVGNN